MYWNPTNSTQIPENQKPPQTQKLRNSNSETQKVRVSDFPRQSFRVGQFRAVLAWHKKSKTRRLQWSPTHFGVFVPDFFGQNRATQRLCLKNSKTQTQKLVFRVSESTFRVSETDFPSFRVEGFACREGPCRFQYMGATQSTYNLQNSSVSVHSLHFMVCAPLNLGGDDFTTKIARKADFSEPHLLQCT